MLAVTMFAIFSVGIFYLSLDTIQRDSKIQFDNEALLYAQEGLEAVRNMRDRDFLLLTNGDHGLSFASDTWIFIPAPENIDDFYYRTITVEDVYRDTNGDIAATGTLDPEMKKVTAQVEWSLRNVFPRSIELSTYLSNWTGDDWFQTTCTEFDTGTFSSTETAVTTSPPTDNCAIKLTLEEEQSSFFSSADIGEHGNDVVVDGNYAYVATAKTQTGLTIVDISDLNNPVVIAQLDVEGKGEYITKDGNYVYMGVEDDNKGLAIVDVTNPAAPSLTASLNVGDLGNQVAVSGNYLYMGVDDDDQGFVVVDITTKSSPAIVDSLDLNTEVQAVYLNGNYAYLGVDDDQDGLRVIDISNPLSVSQVASLDVGEEVNAIEISGFYAYLGIEDTGDSLQVINISTPTSPSMVTSLDIGGEIQDLKIEGDYLYAAVDEVSAGLAVINISVPSSPTLSYNSDITGKATGIDTNSGNVFISIDVNNRGLVIEGLLVPGVTTSGTYTSNVLDTGSVDTRYNFIEWDHTEVPGGSVKFQIKTADSSWNLASATWVGSDGTNATYYETSPSTIILDSANTGVRYIQFMLFLESDGVTTPEVESVRINYNP
ncbi:MAG: hypothetical protein Q8P27_01200 [Candidatus Peregrinibacteria bacterium]|nr:hypothetical protein [Candidatus Peregrinibacteria bacterium]